MSVVLAVAALPCGLVIGVLLGALGGGGSILAVPALVYLLGQSPHEATAGALIVVAVGAVTGLACHARGGRVRWAAGAVFGLLGTAGSFLGTRWSAALDPTALMAAFAGLMLAVAATLLLQGRRKAREQKEAPGRQGRQEAPGRRERQTSGARRYPARIAVTASAVGLLTGFFGVGGGFVVVPALTLVLGLEMPVAVGTSLLVILINSTTALAIRAGTGALDWPLLAGFAACTAVGSYLGNRLSARLPASALTRSFASLIAVLAVGMAATAIPRL
ncbi:sulfite exporter TauE/SafE family protein [Streptomyces sp. NPDC101150]|uniref:sulfite exporter TauE/SafE family protein n=1 Tax=Streptomyces sp. NPDC101150 TaxID=3366114 RepID=UPI003821275B